MRRPHNTDRIESVEGGEEDHGKGTVPTQTEVKQRKRVLTNWEHFENENRGPGDLTSWLKLLLSPPEITLTWLLLSPLKIILTMVR